VGGQTRQTDRQRRQQQADRRPEIRRLVKKLGVALATPNTSAINDALRLGRPKEYSHGHQVPSSSVVGPSSSAPPKPGPKEPLPAAWAAVLVTIGLACALITMPFLATTVAVLVSVALAGFIVYAAARMVGSTRSCPHATRRGLNAQEELE